MADEGLSRAEATEKLEFDFYFWAREKQIPPEGYWFVHLILAGRGWGKTRTGTNQVLEWAQEGVESIALIAETPGDARAVMIEGPSGILAMSPPWFRPEYEPTKRRITWPRLRDDWIVRPGPRAHIYSGNNPGQLRGPQHEKAWGDEMAKWPYAQKCWENLLFGMRDANDPQIIVTTTPTPIEILKEIRDRKSTILTSGSTYENRANLTQIYYEEVIEPLEGTELAAQEIYAQLLEEAAGAFFKRDRLEANRIPAGNDIADKLQALEDAGVELTRIGVAVDPAAKFKPKSDETGIIAAAVDIHGHGYVLADASGRFTPARWAARTAETFKDVDGDVVVYESNQGGDMVKLTLHSERRSLPLREVTASRSKEARAEPIALKEEKGLVHMVGFYKELEDELCTWIPGKPSPSRLDAMVWILTHLMIGPKTARRPQLPRMLRGE